MEKKSFPRCRLAQLVDCQVDAAFKAKYVVISVQVAVDSGRCSALNLLLFVSSCEEGLRPHSQSADSAEWCGAGLQRRYRARLMVPK